MPALIVDKRDELAGQPGLHAICLGFSDYPHLLGGAEEKEWNLGMRQLTATAQTAADVATWLKDQTGLAAPLKTLRVLLSPTPAEQAAGRLGDFELAERKPVDDALLAWQADCSVSPEDTTLFFFAGHGVEQTPTSPLVLLREFGGDGGNPLRHAFDLQNLHQGLAPSDDRPDVARTQLWFVDSCRDAPADLTSQYNSGAGELFPLRLARLDNRCAPIFYAALPGAAAYSIIGESSIFGRALLQCLDGRAGRKASTQDGSWVVTVGSLISSIQKVATEIALESGGQQEVFTGGLTPRLETVLRRLDGIPEAQVKLTLTPPAAQAALAVSRLDDGAPVSLPRPLDPNPYSSQWRAGFYQFALQTPDAQGAPQIHAVEPPIFEWQDQA